MGERPIPKGVWRLISITMWIPTTRRPHSRNHLGYETDLTDAEWAITAPMLAVPLAGGHPAKWPIREIVNAIFYVPRGGTPCD